MQNKRVMALGFFDGVHIGHGKLLQRVVQRAGELNAVPSAITFDAHPESVILGQGAPLLTTVQERVGLMRRLYGIQDVIVVPFDDQFMRMDWQRFITSFAVGTHGAAHLVAGHDFHFGYRGEGNPQRLQQLCAQSGIGCDIIPPEPLDGIIVSSTYIRTLIAQGEMERAAQFLGHPHLLSDQVRHGKKLGTRLGFPTLNLHIPPGCITPAFGAYATRVWIDGVPYCAATNVGVRPTVDHCGSVTVEASLLDFSGDLYGKTVHVEFHRYLRPEQKFDSLDALRAQVLRDVEEVRNYFK